MRTTIKVTDLTPRQWDALQNSPLVGYVMLPGVVGVCAQFELSETDVRHIEMPIQVFTTVLRKLAQVEIAEAALTPDALPDVVAGHVPQDRRLARLPSAEQVRNLSAREAADLAASMNQAPDNSYPARLQRLMDQPRPDPVVIETPSIFPGAPPIRHHADGSQTYGPYARPVEDISEFPSMERYE